MKKIIFISLFFILNSSFLIINCFGQWEPDVRLTYAPGNSYTSSNNAECIAANGNSVHTVWFDYRDGDWEIYYKRSTDGGTTWGLDTRLTNNTAYSGYPSVAVSGSLVHVVWQDERDGNYEIYYKRSTDCGISWGADTRLTNDNGFSGYPSIAVSGSIVHLVYEHNPDNSGNYEIFYKRSADSGINWGADTRLTNQIDYSNYPSIAVSGDTVHVVWQDNRYTYFTHSIFYKQSTDGGISWHSDHWLSNYSFEARFPSIAVSGLLVHVVWQDERHDNYEIYYKRSTNGGTNWGPDTRLTNDTATSGSTSIAVSGSLVHVVWIDGRDGNGEIYYKRSAEGGTNFSVDIRLTNNTAYSGTPSIAVSGSLVHVIWHDGRDGNYEIYYKRNSTGNLVGIQNISTEIPSAFSLEQNYPNPFNSNTIIRFQIKDSRFVNLKVFDILGKEVATLVNEYLQPGTYETNFDASMLTGGIYFYRLQTENYTETKKLILKK